jgi:glycosyltransferase involved in cell wall biosynthesis
MASGPGTVVLIGSLAPHKNIGLILGLAPQLAALGLRIAVVGTRDDRVFAKAEASHDVTNVIWLGRVSDDGLAALMRDSLCLCFPSLAEGFGLPALEAMAIGCPVICSDIASLREVCGDAALYASASDSSSWLSQLTRLRDDEMLHSHLSEKGPLRAKHFSWNETGRNYLRILSDLDAP